MTVPLMVLAALAIVAGFIGLPYAFQENFGLPYDQFGHFLQPEGASEQAIVMDREARHIAQEITDGKLTAEEAISHPEHHLAAAKEEVRHHHHQHDVQGEWLFMGISIMLAVVGWVLARWLYKEKDNDIVAEKGGFAFKLLNNKYYVDEIYNFIFVNPVVKGSEKVLWKFFDAGLIDGLAVNGSAKTVGFIGRFLKVFHNGYVQSYLFYFLIGVLVLASIIL